MGPRRRRGEVGDQRAPAGRGLHGQPEPVEADHAQRRRRRYHARLRSATSARPSAMRGSTTTTWRPGTQNPCIVSATNVALSQPAATAARTIHRPRQRRPPAGPARTAPATTPATRRRCRSPGRRAGRRGAGDRPEIDPGADDGELAGVGEVVAGGVDGPAAVPGAVGEQVQRRGGGPPASTAIRRRSAGRRAAGRCRARRRPGRTSRPATARRRSRRTCRPGGARPARRREQRDGDDDGERRRHLRVDLRAVGGERDADERRADPDRRRRRASRRRRIASPVVSAAVRPARAPAWPWPPPTRRGASAAPARPAAAGRAGTPAARTRRAASSAGRGRSRGTAGTAARRSRR